MTSTRKAGAVTAALLPLLSAAAGILRRRTPCFPQSTTGATIATRIAPTAHGAVLCLTPDRTHAVLFERTHRPVPTPCGNSGADEGATLRERRLRPDTTPRNPTCTSRIAVNY
jgi:hypothetical protein